MAGAALEADFGFRSSVQFSPIPVLVPVELAAGALGATFRSLAFAQVSDKPIVPLKSDVVLIQLASIGANIGSIGADIGSGGLTIADEGRLLESMLESSSGDCKGSGA